ncbi:hypothetical protein [Pseudomonas citronellolis]|uniref:hypothetical protein n=1 Tax=Pseudomonas citronellolis TaxID=53408 RepID=UPI00209F0E63|nr:hypothetical protein [Pseudomonas citronellolis]MCP1607681.1 hypothetical protein [Pseudomonas citronellolis]MCP1657813.1 hypothetical protein [Pseudomonas citronellolis]MCP1724659.1 hypothetical protein [Pseudomonas citronellolis]
MEIESLQRLTPNFFLYTAIFVFSFLAPGFLFWHIHNPSLFLELDILKLAALSLAITAPTFIVPFFITSMIYRLLKHTIPDQIHGYGEQVDWYVRHGWSNSFNMYAMLALFYLFNANGKTILATILGVIVVNVTFEFILMIRFVKRPDDTATRLSLREDTDLRQ